MTSPTSSRPDDSLLCAWLDAELDPSTHQQVSLWLQQHPEDAALVRLWAADRDALRARLDACLAEPVPQAWLDMLHTPATQASSAWAAQRPSPRWLALAASVALLTGLGGGWLGWQLGTAPARASTATGPAPWVQRAATAHAVYVPEQKHPVEVSVNTGDSATQRAQEEHLARWLTKRLNQPVRLFNLRSHGFVLVGGRLLPDAHQPSAQLMYQNDLGERVTVYLRQPDTPVPAAFRHEQIGSLGLFYWVNGRTGYALAGEMPRERLLALAQVIDTQTAE